MGAMVASRSKATKASLCFGLPITRAKKNLSKTKDDEKNHCSKKPKPNPNKNPIYADVVQDSVKTKK